MIYDIDNEIWNDIIDYHFENLSSKNNGSVLSFASGDSNPGAVRRYIEELDCMFRKKRHLWRMESEGGVEDMVGVLFGGVHKITNESLVGY